MAILAQELIEGLPVTAETVAKFGDGAVKEFKDFTSQLSVFLKEPKPGTSFELVKFTDLEAESWRILPWKNDFSANLLVALMGNSHFHDVDSKLPGVKRQEAETCTTGLIAVSENTTVSVLRMVTITESGEEVGEEEVAVRVNQYASRLEWA